MALQQQRATKQMQGGRVLRNAAEDVAGETLGVMRLPPVNGG
jgi:hypothetical protein